MADSRNFAVTLAGSCTTCEPGINSNYAYLYGLAEQVYAGWGGGPVMLLSFSAILSRRAQSILNWWYCIASSRPRTGQRSAGAGSPRECQLRTQGGQGCDGGYDA
jgi:hypothetical protein